MNSKKRKVVLTGGGTVGHVMLNKLLIPDFINQDTEPVYIGSKDGIEKEIINSTCIRYREISSGKLRRYLSLENLKDMFKVLKGILDARKILKKEKPEFVFSKGGFVSVPVVLASKSLNIPVYIHESDLTPGLANKIAAKFATKIFVTFKKTMDLLPEGKTEYIGPVTRDDLVVGTEKTGYELTSFTHDKPVLLIMGGSLGSQSINQFIRDNIDTLTQEMQLIHLCGYGNIDESLQGRKGYVQYEFVKDDLAHLMKISDFVVGRSGSNAIFEFLLNEKPMILIPLPLSQSRGDQIENASFFEEKGYAAVIHEENLTIQEFQNKIDSLQNNRSEIVKRMKQFNGGFKSEALVNQLLNMEVTK